MKVIFWKPSNLFTLTFTNNISPFGDQWRQGRFHLEWNHYGGFFSVGVLVYRGALVFLWAPQPTLFPLGPQTKPHLFPLAGNQACALCSVAQIQGTPRGAHSPASWLIPGLPRKAPLSLDDAGTSEKVKDSGSACGCEASTRSLRGCLQAEHREERNQPTGSSISLESRDA